MTLTALDVVLTALASPAGAAVAAALALRRVRISPLGVTRRVLGGLALSLGIIGATLPVLERITGPETARNE